ncbi:kynureninase [Aquibium oceanicum]|uniref:Kynureninase n=1 Tax=Aquibium oceanicum TaxID=1670800 RepID=A0A1L3SRH9_9HYPH|nr:kynureninase [Aquibium oceanicum]APH72009.1 kynureninase [Aquibium oceanicum]
MTDFARTRALFELPEGIVYLDGNSLGPLPRAARERVAREVSREWGEKLIRGWNEAGWMDLPETVGDKIARLIGAAKGTVVAGDSTSINLHKALTAAVSLAGPRKVVLSDSGNFPTDLYVAQMALRALGGGHELKVVAPEEVAGTIDDTVAVLMLTQVDYKTGRLHDMQALTAKARENGVVSIWDLAHSAGALPVDLAGADADFAVGCGYKYLNGGPGAPAFIYVRPGLGDRIDPVLAGWMGHEAPFAFDLDYRPAGGIQRMRVGTPPILSMASLDAALDAWDGVSMDDVRDRSIELSERFIAEIEARCPELTLASPRDPSARGSQVSVAFREGYAAMQAAIANGLIGDFRAPDIMRFGFTPLYIGMDDVVRAAETIERVMRDKLWDRADYRARAKVT